MEKRPTAALCFNDVVALGVIEALQLSDLKVGVDFGVVGQSISGCGTESSRLDDHRYLAAPAW
jgi:hypothetical protein